MFGGPLNRADRRLLWMLVAVGLVDTGCGVYFSLVRSKTGYLLAFVVTYFAGLLMVGVATLQAQDRRTLSASGFLWFLAVNGIFTAWLTLVMIMSIATRLWTHFPPFTFDFSVAIGLAPLLAGVYLFGRRLSR